MPLTLVDLIFLAAAFFIAKLIVKRSWFSTSHDFVKFILALIITFFVTIKTVTIVPYHYFYLSAMQFIVLSQLLVFLIIWRILNFEKLFYNIPLFIRRYGGYLNYISAGITAVFITFLIFLFSTSFNTKFLMLYDIAERSYIVKLMSFRLYIAYFKSIPPQIGDLSMLSGFGIKKQQGRINEEREKAGLSPVGMQTSQIRIPTGPVPQDIPFAPTLAPSPIPEPTIVIVPISVPTAQTRPSPTPPRPTAQIIQRTGRTRIVTIVVPTPLPTSVPEPTATPEPLNISAFEQQIFELTNLERINNSLPPFVWSNAITAVARAHSADMMNRDFFAHVNPDGVNHGQRLKIGGVQYKFAAENIARGTGTAERFVQGWMNSPGHRANILNSRFKKIGIGVAETSSRYLYSTQDFTD